MPPVLPALRILYIKERVSPIHLCHWEFNYRSSITPPGKALFSFSKCRRTLRGFIIWVFKYAFITRPLKKI